MMLIGSQALLANQVFVPHCNDTDYICTFDEFKAWTKEHKGKITHCVPTDDSTFHVVKDGWNYEFSIAWEGSTNAMLLQRYSHYTVAPLEVLLALKMSHRYKKDSPHFVKTMRDIQLLRENDVEVGDWLETYWLPIREKETYNYSHPKLDVTKGEFFAGDGVRYVYDHDTIHEAVALSGKYNRPEIFPVPAYRNYMQEGSQVMTSKDKFFACTEEIRLYGVYEETCVLALERSQIPYNFEPDARWSFEKALMKVCTSITSGWFREYAWENFDKVLDLYAELGENDYIKRFQDNAYLLKPYEGETK